MTGRCAASTVDLNKGNETGVRVLKTGKKRRRRGIKEKRGREGEREKRNIE